MGQSSRTKKFTRQQTVRKDKFKVIVDLTNFEIYLLAGILSGFANSMVFETLGSAGEKISRRRSKDYPAPQYSIYGFGIDFQPVGELIQTIFRLRYAKPNRYKFLIFCNQAVTILAQEQTCCNNPCSFIAIQKGIVNIPFLVPPGSGESGVG